MAKAEVYNSGIWYISQKLDELALQILNVMQSIILERQYLDENFKDGFINLAKSRYLMRGQKINTFQINTSNLNSLVKVIEKSETVNGIEFTSFQASNSVKANGCMKGNSYIGDGLRNLKATVSEECETNTPNGSSDDFKSSRDDPLHWFGVLVPKALKDCQSRFVQAIETSVKLASLQNQLKALCKEYRSFRLQKSKASS